MSLLCLGALLLAFGPLFPWLAGRLGDGLEEPWAVALLPVLACLGRPPRALDLRLTSACLALYAVGYPFLPQLARGGLAALTLAAFLSAWRGRKFEPGLAGLLVLSLPGLSTAQFYLGYPVRAFCARTAAVLLGVHAQGACLRLDDRLIAVDAPCSGLKMLWVGMLLVFLLAALRRWELRTTLRWSALAAVSLLAANVLRIASLFLVELGRAPSLPWMHEGVGLVLFATVVLALGYAAPGTNGTPSPGPWRGERVFLAALVFAVLVSCFPPLQSGPKDIDFPGWPATFEGRRLTPEPVSEEERRFFREGRIGRFRDGQRQILMRFVPDKTRKLHSSAECYRGLGYTIEPRPLEDGWGCFLATRGVTRLKVRERIGGYPDVSQWYWSADGGPWWAITVVEPF